MDQLSLSKSDLKVIFAFSAVIPLLSFIFGFFMAERFEVSTPSTIVNETPLTSTDVPLTEITIEHKIMEPAEAQSSTTSEPEKTVLTHDTSTPAAKQFIVQAGLFSSEENAKRLTRTLEKSGLRAQTVSEPQNGTSLFRVIIGSFDSEREAKTYADSIKREHAIKLFVKEVASINSNDWIASI